MTIDPFLMGYVFGSVTTLAICLVIDIIYALRK